MRDETLADLLGRCLAPDIEDGQISLPVNRDQLYQYAVHSLPFLNSKEWQRLADMINERYLDSTQSREQEAQQWRYEMTRKQVLFPVLIPAPAAVCGATLARAGLCLWPLAPAGPCR